MLYLLTKSGCRVPQVEFEFSISVPPKATADHHSGGGRTRFCLFMYANEWWEKKPLLEWRSAVVATADHHSHGGPELKLRW